MFHDGPFELLARRLLAFLAHARHLSARGRGGGTFGLDNATGHNCPLLPSRHGTLDSIGTSPAKDEMGGAASAGATEPLGHSACCHRERRSARPVDSEEANRTRTRWRVFKHAAADRRGEHKIGTIQLRHRLDGSAVTNRFVQRVYSRLSPVYDLLFNRILQPGRVTAARRMARSRGDVLEVGVGTALSVSLYPPDLRVTGIDLSAPMLARARDRVARAQRPCRLVQMDAAKLSFADNTFDFVYAPYTVSVVPDPVRVLREMQRVCKPGGVVLILNHFLSSDPLMARVERALSPVTIHFGFRSDSSS